LPTLQTNDGDRRGTVALLLWGNVIEDFLDTIGLSLNDFCERFTGSWVFGYIDALSSAGWRSILFLVSRKVERPTRFQHAPSGTPICVLPAWKAYTIATRGMRNPYGGSVDQVFGPVRGLRRLSCFARKEVGPYLATPLGALARNLRRERCRAILVQEYEYARFDMCVLLGTLLRLPVYATFQGGIWHGRLEGLIRPIALRAANGLAIGADGEIGRVREQYGISTEKIWRVHNPVDVTLWQPFDRDEARHALRLPSHARIVIYHGRIDMHRKGLDVLLEAWEQIGANLAGQDVRLLIIGSGPDDEILRNYLRRPELAGIQWIHKFELDRTTIRRYLSAADVYVLPSRLEGFPVAPLEAMSCGLPIVGSDIPAMSNILNCGSDSGGLTVPREDPRALAEAIQRLLGNREFRRELGLSARRNVEARFSIESVGRQLDEMLSQR
jgi:starch synthase